VSYSLKDCLSVLKEMNLSVAEMIACGGGGTSPLWRQMMADNYNCSVKTPKSNEGPALGAALLAGVGSGLYDNVVQACKAVVSYNPAQPPISENVTEYVKYYELYKKLYPALKDSYTQLSKL